MTIGEVQAYCKERLAIYKVPEHVVFVEGLPYSETGKVVRRRARRADPIAATPEDDEERFQCCSCTRSTVSSVRKEDEFEAAFREGWMPTLAKDDDARLLWYMNHAHGSGVSYNVVTITGVRDGAAWETIGAPRSSRATSRTGCARRTPTPRRDRQDDAARVLVARSRRWTSTTVPTDGAEHELLALHGRHRLAVLVARRLHQVLGRALLPADPALGREHRRP